MVLVLRRLSYIPPMRFRLFVVVFALLAAACGGSGSDTGNGSPFTAAPSTEAPATEAPSTDAPTTTGGDTSAAPTETPTSTTSVPRPPTEGPAAPAFTTILSDGTEFSLEDEQNPVYLVFWAEW